MVSSWNRPLVKSAPEPGEGSICCLVAIVVLFSAAGCGDQSKQKVFHSYVVFPTSYELKVRTQYLTGLTEVLIFFFDFYNNSNCTTVDFLG